MSFSQELQFWNKTLHSSSVTTILERPDILWIEYETTTASHIKQEDPHRTSILIFKDFNPSKQMQYLSFSLSPTNLSPVPHKKFAKNIQPLQSYIQSEELLPSDVDFIVFQFLLFFKELERYDLSLSFPLLPLVVIDPNEVQLTKKFQIVPSFQSRKSIIDVVESCVELIQSIGIPLTETHLIFDWLEDPPPSIYIGIEILKGHILNSWNLKYLSLKKKYDLLKQYHNSQNEVPSPLLPKKIDVSECNRSIIHTGSSIKMLEKNSQKTIIEISMTNFNNKNARRLRKELVSILHSEILESKKTQIQRTLEWLNKEIQIQRRRKILQTQIRHSQD